MNDPIYARIGRIRPLGHHGPPPTLSEVINFVEQGIFLNKRALAVFLYIKGALENAFAEAIRKPIEDHG